MVRIIIFRIIDRGASAAVTKAKQEFSEAREARLRAMVTVLRSFAGFVLAFVALVMALQVIGVNVVPLMTTAGVAGLAIGFGSQKLVRDVASGFFILVEDQYGVGDVVTIAGRTGTVEALEMRTTSIRDRDGALHVLSNGIIEAVCNHSR